MTEDYSGIEDYLPFLEKLREDRAAYFVEGGQAVNFWAELIDANSDEGDLSKLRPFTSRDCDIWVDFETWLKIKEDSPQNLVQGQSPSDGQLGILTLEKSPRRAIDIMSNVYGIPPNKYPQLLERSLDDGNIKVMDPVYLLLSKCHCLIGLDQTRRQDERHLKILALVLPEYLKQLVSSAEDGELEDRQVVKEIKLLQKIARTQICRRALETISLEPASLIPLPSLADSSLPLLRKFAEQR